MKSQFLNLVEDVKNTGVDEKLRNVTSKEELQEVWQMFCKNNQQILEKIQKWAEMFKKGDKTPILCYKQIRKEDALAICVVIYSTHDYEVSEVEICEMWDELSKALCKDGCLVAIGIAKYLMAESYLCDMVASDIFPDETTD